MLLLVVRLQELAHIMGVVVSETTSEMTIATLRVTANSRNSRPTMPPISRMGMNTAISEMLMESTVKPISREPFSAASIGRHARFEIARDVLDHHDGVVHHEAGGDGQRHQREIVERVTEQIHHPEGADERQRHGDAGNERGPDAAQKDEDDQDHQSDGDHQGDFDVVHRGADGRGAVESRSQS